MVPRMSEPKADPDRPSSSPLARWAGRAWLRWRGWRVEGEAPNLAKFVFIAAPHTSNWDVVFMLAAAGAMGIRISWLGKNSLFKFPLGPLMRATGALPVDRSKRNELVKNVAALFEARRGLILAVSPEGTRKYVDTWKSGFYQIALQANVAIGLGYLDYGQKTCGFKGTLVPTGNVRADMERIRAAYQGVTARNPAQWSEPRLREEPDAPRTASTGLSSPRNAQTP